MIIKERIKQPGTGNTMPRLKQLTGLIAGLISAFLTVGSASGQAPLSGCGPLQNQYGPFDYRAYKKGDYELDIVEQYHFGPNVESLVRGMSTVNVGGDVDYTLRAFPNHHRALMAMVRFGEKLKSPHPPGVGYSVECYFERALRFRPDDSTARMIYARFLAKNGREPEATKQLELATQTAGDNPFTHYNIGLIYFDLKKYDQALKQAHKAYGLGFVQPALRDQLKIAGKWKEPYEKSAQAPAKVVSQDPVDPIKLKTESLPDTNPPSSEK